MLCIGFLLHSFVLRHWKNHISKIVRTVLADHVELCHWFEVFGETAKLNTTALCISQTRTGCIQERSWAYVICPNVCIYTSHCWYKACNLEKAENHVPNLLLCIVLRRVTQGWIWLRLFIALSSCWTSEFDQKCCLLLSAVCCCFQKFVQSLGSPSDCIIATLLLPAKEGQFLHLHHYACFHALFYSVIPVYPY